MKKPSPFIPQGSLLENSSANHNHLRIAFFIVAIHLVFFGGLLMQGCKKDAGIASDGNADTDEEPAAVPDEFAIVPDTYYRTVDEMPLATNGSPADPDRGVGSFGSTDSPGAGDGGDRVFQNASVPGNEAGQTNSNPDFFGVSDLSDSRAPGGAGASTSETGAMREHVIAKGDSFYSLSLKYKVSLRAVQEANAGLNPRRIKLGQTVFIPPAQVAKLGQNPAEDSASIYVVKKDDTLSNIASKHGTTVKLLKAMNNLRTDRILIGQKLVIPEDDENGVPTSSVGYVQPATQTP